MLTFRQKQTKGSITIQIHATNSIATAKFFDLIKKAVEDGEDTLKGQGIHEVIRDDDDDGNFQRNGFKDHWALQTFNFKYEFNYGN